MAATNPVPTPATYLSGASTVYATVTNAGCTSLSVPVALTITPAPAANTAPPQFACANAMGVGTFNLTSLNNTISGGVGTVSWWTNSTATMPIATPGAYTTNATVIVYANVTSGGCTSPTVGVQLNVTPTPTANPAGPLSACATSGNQASFNLTSLNNTINNTPGTTINWYTDVGATNAIGTPASFTSVSTTVYATAANMFCASAPIPVQLVVNPTPTPNPAGPLTACSTGAQATFNLTSLNATISGGAATVNWYSNAAGTIPIANPANFLSGSATVYATVESGPCESGTIPVQLTVNPAPTANPTTFDACVVTLIPPNIQYDLPGTEAVINGGTGLPVNWYADAAGTNVIDIEDILTLPGTVYATVDNGTCESATVPIPVNIEFAPSASPATATACAGPGGTATFNLTTLNSQINNTPGLTITFYTNSGATNPVPNPTAFTTGSATVYAVVSTANGCGSNPVPVTLTVTPLPAANTASAQACDNGSGQGAFNLTTLNGTVSGGVGTVSWFTNSAGTNPIANPVAYTSGTATVYATVTNNGCTSPTAAVTLTVLTAPPAFSASLGACESAGGQAIFNLTTANSTITGGGSGTVNWFTNANGTGPIATPATYLSGTTTVFAQVSLGACNSVVVPVSLTVTPAPTAISPPAMQQCATAGNQATFNLTTQNSIVNAGSGLTVTWYTNAAATNQVPNPAAYTTGSTTVYATVTNGNCSSAPVALTLTVLAAPIATPTSLSACSTTGNQAVFNLTSANAAVSGGAGTVGWFLNAAGTNPVANPAAFTSASITVYANVSNGVCTSATVPVMLTVNSRPSVSIALANDLDCSGDSNASLSVDVSSGTVPFVFDWNNNALDGIEDPTGLAAGNYSLTVVDANNCQGTANLNITDPAPLTLSCEELNPVSGPGNSDGAAEITFSGGTAPYTLSWSGPGSGSQPQAMPGVATINGLDAGTYDLTITDFNGCEETCSFTINDANCTIGVSLTSDNPTCSDSDDGSINLTVSGGIAPFNFDWNDNTLDGTEDPSNLSPGIYAVTVTAADGCTATGLDTLVGAPAFLLECSQLNPVSATGAEDGAASIVIGGGVAPYILLWSGPEMGGQNENMADTVVLDNLLAGVYNLTLADANGCEAVCSFTIGEPCGINASADVVNPSCSGEADGSIDLSITGGLMPYTIDWNVDSLDTIEDPGSLAAGTYLVTVTDAGACVDTLSITLSEPALLELACALLDSVSTVGGNDGRITVTSTGGVLPYTLSWGGPSTDTLVINIAGVDTISGLSAGLYALLLTDANGCTTTCAVSIGEPLCTVSLNAVVTPINCNGNAEGAITLTLNGGTAPISYDWNLDALDGDSAPDSLGAGTYIVVITDAINCVLTDTVDITEPAAIVLNCAETSPVSGPGVTDGVATVDVQGGIFPYTLILSGPSADTIAVDTAGVVTLSNLGGGLYTVVLIDSLGCEADCQFAINVSGCNLNVSLSVTDPLCNGSNDGVITATSSGAAAPLAFDWNDDTYDGQSSLSGLAPGYYAVTVTDNLGCLAVADTMLNEPEALIVSCAEYLPVSTIGGTDGAMQFSSSGGTVPLQVNISGPVSVTIMQSTNETIIVPDLSAGDYVISIADANGCQDSCSFTITEPICNINLAISGSDLLCNGDNSGAIDLTVNGGLAPLTFDWNIDALDGTEDPVSLAAGTYAVTVSDAAGCSATTSVTLIEPPVLILSCAQVSDVTTVNGTDGSGTVTFSGGTAPYTISWSGPVSGSQTSASAATLSILSLAVGTYNLTLLDANGCSHTCSFTIDGPVCAITVALTPTNESCAGSTDGAIDLTVNGGIGALTYDWNVNALDGTEDPTGLAPNNYVVIVTDAAGCSASGIATVAPGSALPSATISSGGAICEDDCFDFTITLTGTPPFAVDYTLDSGAGPQPLSTVINANSGTVTICPATLGITSGQIALALTNISDANCQNTLNSSVVLQVSPHVTTNLNQTLCSGESLVVNGQTFNEANPAGTEILSGANGCDSTVVVNLSFLPNSASSLNSTLCFGESLIVGGQTFNAANPVGTVVLDNASATGCDSTINVALQFLPQLTASLEGGGAVCAGTPTQITFRFTGGSVFDVTYAEGATTQSLNDIGDGFTLTVNPSVTTAYSILTATSEGNSCPVTIGGPVTVQVSSLGVQAQVTSNFDGFGVSCAGNTDGVVSATASGGITPLSYQWNNGAITPMLSGVGAGSYAVTITDAAGCSGSATVTLTEPEAITLKTDSQSPPCFGDLLGAILLEELNGGAAPYAYSLDGQSYQGLAGTPFAIPNLPAGSYTLYVRDANSCTVEVDVVIPTPQELVIDLGPDQTIRLGDSILLDPVLSFTAATFTWTPRTDLTDSVSLATYAGPILTTTYTLTASDENGCQAEDAITIFIDKKRRVYVPNAFSPDDDGINDYITVYADTDVVAVKSFRIFDRWGNLLFFNGPFQPNIESYGWDGEFKGKPMNAGVYVYFAEIEFADGQVETFKGDVSLLR
ncbi:MAG: gliding motility-associated C-terminal domain-containing protein [Saprospiraceae bacterium]|nr:gliding motility-associated C-terminal domain-containing protein [Saprospiraceae bacterium]